MSSHVSEFNTQNKLLTAKLLNQGYQYHKFRRAFSKFYRRHIDLISKFNVGFTVVTAFFMSTETHAKRFLTVWKRSVSTTLKRSFTVLANQIIVSETFQAFQILTNHISVRKTLSWKPCLVSNVFSVCRISQSKSRGLNLFYIFFFFFFFFNFT